MSPLIPIILIVLGIFYVVVGAGLLVGEVNTIPDAKAEYERATAKYRDASDLYQRASDFLKLAREKSKP